MAISVENEQLATTYLDMVRDSDLPAAEKESWIDYIHKAKSSTNGFKPEEKIQLMSELQLRMVGRMLQDRSDSVTARKELKHGIDDLEKSTAEQIKQLDKAISDKIETLKSNQEDMKALNTETRDMMKKIDERLSQNDRETYKLVGSSEAESGEAPENNGWWAKFFDFLKDAKWAIATTIGLVVLMLVIRPQLADMVEHLVQYIK